MAWPSFPLLRPQFDGWRVATYLAVASGLGDDVMLRRIVKATHISTKDVERALARLEADGLLETTPTIAVSTAKIRIVP